MSPAELADLYERRRRALLRRPALGRASENAQVHMAGGACEVTDGARRLVVDLPPEDGGTDRAPHPGALMRASIGASLALGYSMWGARLGVPIRAVEVDVLVEYDARGQLALDDSVAVGWGRVLLDTRITTSAPEADVRRVVEMANRHNPMLANLSAAIARVDRLRIVTERKVP